MQRNAARLSPRPDKLRIKSVLREKPGVRAPLDDSSLVKDQDEVRAAYGGKPVSDDESGALPRESGQCALHACFRDRIEGAGGFVQQEGEWADLPCADSIRGDDDAGHRHGEDDADENAHLQVAPHPNQEI